MFGTTEALEIDPRRTERRFHHAIEARVVEVAGNDRESAPCPVGMLHVGPNSVGLFESIAYDAVERYRFWPGERLAVLVDREGVEFPTQPVRNRLHDHSI